MSLHRRLARLEAQRARGQLPQVIYFVSGVPRDREDAGPAAALTPEGWFARHCGESAEAFAARVEAGPRECWP